MPRLQDGAINATSSLLVIFPKYQWWLGDFGWADISIATLVFTPVLETIHVLRTIVSGSLQTQEKCTSGFSSCHNSHGEEKSCKWRLRFGGIILCSGGICNWSCVQEKGDVLQSQKLPFQQETCFTLQYNACLMTDDQLWPQTQDMTFFSPQLVLHTEATRNTPAPCAPPGVDLERDFSSHRTQVGVVAEGRPPLHCESKGCCWFLVQCMLQGKDKPQRGLACRRFG